MQIIDHNGDKRSWASFHRQALFGVYEDGLQRSSPHFGGVPIFVELFGCFYSILPKSREADDIIVSVGRITKLLPPAHNIHLVLDGQSSLQKHNEQQRRRRLRKVA